MGFGSYDESEQQRQEVDTSDDDGDDTRNLHENDYDGEMTVENGSSTDELLGQLQEIKADREE